MKNHIYQVRNLKHTYQARPVLEIDKLSIVPKSIVGLMGPNGSGKSTLLKLLAFIEKPLAGEILFKGRRAQPFSNDVRFQVTLLTQEPYLMQRSVFKNIAYGLEIRKQTQDCKKRVQEALALVGLSYKSFANRRSYQLSGGEAKRVALAARLVLKPEVLLLDEPTASVDAASAQLIKDASLKAREKWGATLVVASHDQQWLYEICDQVMYVFRGRIFGSGSENMFFGPWRQNADGQWEKILSGPKILVSKPPSHNSVAIIYPDSIFLVKQKTGAHVHVLSGIVSRLILETSSENIIATILAGAFPFTLRLTQKQICDLNLYPGRKIFITYDLRKIRWV
jgi:tungstate transport system ATP-binding protein